jgi:hypothetical protein
MSDTTYNGWSNYATWRVNLEIFDGFNPKGYFTEIDNPDYWREELADNLKEYAHEVVVYTHGKDISNTLLADYARCFLEDVNWYEIAKHLIAEYADEVTA